MPLAQVHCDPHAANMMVRPSQIAAIDCLLTKEKHILSTSFHECWTYVISTNDLPSVQVRKKNGKPELVLLDHGLYRQITDEFRLQYAGECLPCPQTCICDY